MDFRGTEGSIVQEIIKGFVQEPFTRNYWGDLLFGIAQAVNIGRKTQIYEDLQGIGEKTKSPIKKRAIGELLQRFQQVDPDIEKRADDPDFFKAQMLDIQSRVLEDTLASFF